MSAVEENCNTSVRITSLRAICKCLGTKRFGVSVDIIVSQDAAGKYFAQVSFISSRRCKLFNIEGTGDTHIEALEQLKEALYEPNDLLTQIKFLRAECEVIATKKYQERPLAKLRDSGTMLVVVNDNNKYIARVVVSDHGRLQSLGPEWAEGLTHLEALQNLRKKLS